jgi:hypothetical protein
MYGGLPCLSRTGIFVTNFKQDKARHLLRVLCGSHQPAEPTVSKVCVIFDSGVGVAGLAYY